MLCERIRDGLAAAKCSEVMPLEVCVCVCVCVNVYCRFQHTCSKSQVVDLSNKQTLYVPHSLKQLVQVTAILCVNCIAS